MNEGGTKTGIHVIDMDNDKIIEIVKPKLCDVCKKIKYCRRNLKGILWQFYKLGLKVPSGRDKNDGISHFAERLQK